MAQDTTPPLVAQHATRTISDLGGAVTLLGIFGSQSDLHALLKLRGGKTTTVTRGDIVNGQTIVAIEESRIAMARNGTARWLDMPAPRS